LVMLQVILGIIEVVTGFLLGLAYARPPGLSDLAVTLVGVPAAFTFLLPTLAVLWFTFAVLSFIMAYAIWSSRGWSWVASFIFATNALVVGGFGLLIGSIANAIPIALIALVLISLSLYNVRWYLGGVQGVPAYALHAAPDSPYFGPSQRLLRHNVPPALSQTFVPATPRTAWSVICSACGGQSPSTAGFCYWCGNRLA